MSTAKIPFLTEYDITYEALTEANNALFKPARRKDGSYMKGLNVTIQKISVGATPAPTRKGPVA